MTPRLALLLALAGLLAVPGADAAEPAKSTALPFDVLYLTEARPVVLRVRVTTDDQLLGAAWAAFADALFTHLDADKNGTLDAKEVARLRPVLLLLTGQATPAEVTAVRTGMTRAAFVEFLRGSSLGPLRVPASVGGQTRNVRSGFRRGGQATTEELDKALMELMDTDADGKLTVAELTAGIDTLARLDTDENELISTDELLRRAAAPPFFVEEINMAAGQAASPIEFFTLTRKGADVPLARRLLARYGPKPPAAKGPTPVQLGGGLRPQPVPPPESTARRLTKKDLTISPELFEALDQDGDGELDAEELARFGQSALPEVELALRLGKLPKGAKAVEVTAAGKGPVKATAGPHGTEAALEVPGVRLDLAVASDAARAPFLARYRDLFRQFDRDGNGYLDQGEANSLPQFRELFQYLDRDGDGKVFEKELVAAVAAVEPLAAAAARGVVALDVTEAGKGLFGLIDTNNDTRLSIRELRAMPRLVERFDANKDGGLAPAEVPRLFHGTLTRGVSGPGPGFVRVVRYDGRMMPPGPAVGPTWFQRMDRNRDGDVSRREFLGTEEDFRRLDADGDGLISPAEADAVTPVAVRSSWDPRP